MHDYKCFISINSHLKEYHTHPCLEGTACPSEKKDPVHFHECWDPTCLIYQHMFPEKYWFFRKDPNQAVPEWIGHRHPCPETGLCVFGQCNYNNNGIIWKGTGHPCCDLACYLEERGQAINFPPLALVQALVDERNKARRYQDRKADGPLWPYKPPNWTKPKVPPGQLPPDYPKTNYTEEDISGSDKEWVVEMRGKGFKVRKCNNHPHITGQELVTTKAFKRGDYLLPYFGDLRLYREEDKHPKSVFISCLWVTRHFLTCLLFAMQARHDCYVRGALGARAAHRRARAMLRWIRQRP